MNGWRREKQLTDGQQVVGEPAKVIIAALGLLVLCCDD